MSENKPKSQTIKINCRYCKLELLKRNYKEIFLINTLADQQSILHMYVFWPHKDSQASHSKNKWIADGTERRHGANGQYANPFKESLNQL